MVKFLTNLLFSSTLLILYLGIVKGHKTSKITRFGRSLSFDISKLKTDYKEFDELLKPILIERVPDTPGNAQVRKYLSSTMKKYGWVVEENSFKDKTPYGTKEFVNVIANYHIGKNLKNKEKNDEFSKYHTNNRVVLACHYDSKYEKNYEFIGAIDSAVPCALLLDIAKFIHENFSAKEFDQLSRHLQFLFFDGEEAFKTWNAKDSIYGARYHATSLVEKYGENSLDKIDLFVLLDLIGATQSRFPNYFSATSNTYKLMSRIETFLLRKDMLNTKKLYYFANTQGIGGYGGVEDDHIPFLRKNVPILHLIPVPFPPQWHQPTDNYENLDHKRIEDLRVILKLFILQVLNKEQDRLYENEEL